MLLPFFTRGFWLLVLAFLVVVNCVMLLRSPEGSMPLTRSAELLSEGGVPVGPESAQSVESESKKKKRRRRKKRVRSASQKDDGPLTLENLEDRFDEECVKLGRGHLEGIFIQEGACFSRERVQEILIDLVYNVSAVFTEHNITNFLDSGTLLGSFRHKSIVPFDQDADMGIDQKGFEYIQKTPIQFPPEYYMQVWGSSVHPEGTRFKQLPVRVIHRESALYVDVFVYLDYDEEGKKITGPMPSGCFINCRKCPKLPDEDAWEFKVPYDWIYPLQDCPFEDKTMKCPRKIPEYLEYMFGEDYMTPVVFPAAAVTDQLPTEVTATTAVGSTAPHSMNAKDADSTESTSPASHYPVAQGETSANPKYESPTRSSRPSISSQDENYDAPQRPAQPEFLSPTTSAPQPTRKSGECVKMDNSHREKNYIKDICYTRQDIITTIKQLVFTLADIFEHHHITYFLDSGTLLGYFRNKGVIPHDSDGDLGIDEAGYLYLRDNLITVPPGYVLGVYNSSVNPREGRDDKLIARLIHIESALYVDVFAFLDKIKNGQPHVGPLPSWCYSNCVSCPFISGTGKELLVPREWIYPLVDYEFEGRTMTCPNNAEKYLAYMFGGSFRSPVQYH
ncbi:TPA: hypothetical protein N0F65_008856 [Lagenidium giganteum]|uniref:LicD/FKTN/FKRP nucleotidyltransferase domain-containing protein n=1 Tax=Lagenidium giganteum TaxID=4803 RepID=A0AAV2YSA9_9STRA|nr:TPA: hypothetical protein N0F65_008856 [Lagenidium giganteum]